MTHPLFRQLLNAWWLRPESAMAYFHSLKATQELFATHLKRPLLEFGCMDGVNTFILFGGQFEASFDVFLDARTDPMATRNDVGDIFDVPEVSKLDPRWIRSSPGVCVDLGIDWKKSHLVKASRLGLYDKIELIESGSSAGRSLSAQVREKYELIFAPNIYWMVDIGEVLEALKGLLAPGGKLLLWVPTAPILEFMAKRTFASAGPEWLKLVDRGRFANVEKSQRSRDEWLRLFRESDLELVEQRLFQCGLTTQVYEIGLRPFAPSLIKIYHSLLQHDPTAAAKMKEEWTEAFTELAQPFLDESWVPGPQGQSCWAAFLLCRGDRS